MLCARELASVVSRGLGLPWYPVFAASYQYFKKTGLFFVIPIQAFTSALELAWFDELATSFKLLPSASMARAVWLNTD